MDTILLQLNPLVEKNKVPDICVFLWTDFGRLFNKKIRELNFGSCKEKKISKYNFFEKDNIWKAAQYFFNYLWDHEKEEISYISFLHYVDNNVLNSIKDKTKIIHLWSFGKFWENKEKIEYYYSWKQGVEIHPPLIYVSAKNVSNIQLSNDNRPNHLEGETKNKIVSSWIIEAIENYDHDKKLDFSHSI